MAEISAKSPLNIHFYQIKTTFFLSKFSRNGEKLFFSAQTQKTRKKPLLKKQIKQFLVLVEVCVCTESACGCGGKLFSCTKSLFLPLMMVRKSIGGVNHVLIDHIWVDADPLVSVTSFASCGWRKGGWWWWGWWGSPKYLQESNTKMKLRQKNRFMCRFG